MKNPAAPLAVAVLSTVLAACGHSTAHNQHTLTVNASESVSVEPDLAILRIGFDTPAENVKSAYADGVRKSNAIVAALKDAGIPEDAIRSEWQYIDRVWVDEHRFRVEQRWTVKVVPQRAAEILDIAIAAGANSSGPIEWTVKDEKALENQALNRATARAKENATVLAKGMGVHLGSLASVSNQITSAVYYPNAMQQLAGGGGFSGGAPLAIQPHQASRQASVSAVFEID